MTGYTVRPACDSDSRFIYELAMDPRIRLQSTRQEEFSWEQHCEWWVRRREDSGTRIWVMEVGGLPVGQIRYGRCDRRAGGEAEIAISVLPSEWRKRYALSLLRETMPFVRDWLHVDVLVALVLRHNYPSRRLFRRAGFSFVGAERRMERWHVRYEYVLPEVAS